MGGEWSAPRFGLFNPARGPVLIWGGWRCPCVPRVGLPTKWVMCVKRLDVKLTAHVQVVARNEWSCTSTLSYTFISHTQGHFIITFHTHSFWYSKQVTVYTSVTSHRSPFWDHTLAASGQCINSKTSPVIHTKMYTILPWTSRSVQHFGNVS